MHAHTYTDESDNSNSLYFTRIVTEREREIERVGDRQTDRETYAVGSNTIGFHVGEEF